MTCVWTNGRGDWAWVTAACEVCGDGKCGFGKDVCGRPSDCGAPPPMELPGVTCSDALDNDCDGEIDCWDNDCKGDSFCVCETNSDCDDEDVCTFDLCPNRTCENIAALYGDVCSPGGACGPDGAVNIFDILCVLDAFIGKYPDGCEQHNFDIAGRGSSCDEDGAVTVFDIFAVLDAFRGCSCAVPEPCCELSRCMSCSVAWGYNIISSAPGNG